MAKGPSFLIETEAHVKDSAAAAKDLFVGRASGGQSSLGNAWLSGRIDVTNAALSAVISADARAVDGVDYEQHPLTGLWEIDKDDEYNAVDAALSGELQLDDLTADEALGGYVLRGRVPADPTVESVELLVDATDLVITQIEETSAPPRSQYGGLVPAEGGALYTFVRVTLRDYGADVAVAIAPPEGLSTNRWSSDDHPFELQIPKEWEAVPPSALAEVGASAAFAKDDLALIIVEEDLVEAGIGETTLDNYTRFIESSLATDELTVESIDEGSTLQGEPAAILHGADEVDFIRSRQLVYLHELTVGFRAAFAGPKLRMQEADALTDFILNTFLVTEA
jgi:hypothetical protein